MSRNTVHFTISNPAISFLLHDCVKSLQNQIGFLFGEIDQKVSNVTTDSHVDNETIEITVSITASMPFSDSEDLLFTRDGVLNEPLLEIILGEFKKEVVGWYSFTRNQNLSPSICQLFLAHQFSTFFSHIPKDLFLFFQMSTNIVFEENFTYTNKFLCTTGSDVSNPVELHIRQLGESTQAYNAHQPVTKHCTTFDRVLSQIQWDNKDIVNSFETLQSSLCAKLNDEIDNLNCVPSTGALNPDPSTNPSDQDNQMPLSSDPDQTHMDDPMSTSVTSDAAASGNPLPSPGTNKTNKPGARVVMSSGKLHASTTSSHVMSRGSNPSGGTRRPGRVSSPTSPHMRGSHSPATAHAHTLRTRSPAAVKSTNRSTPSSNGPRVTAPGPRVTTPKANGPRPNNWTSKHPPGKEETKVTRILSRKQCLPLHESPPHPPLEGERARTEVDLDKSRDAYSSQEY